MPTESHGSFVDKENIFPETKDPFVMLESTHELEEGESTLAIINVTYGDLSINHHTRFKEINTRTKQRMAKHAILKTNELINSLD